MENQVNNEEQDKPTLSQAREYLSELLNIASSMAEGKALKAEYSPGDIWKIFHQHLGNVDRLIEIAQKQLRGI